MGSVIYHGEENDSLCIHDTGCNPSHPEFYEELLLIMMHQESDQAQVFKLLFVESSS